MTGSESFLSDNPFDNSAFQVTQLGFCCPNIAHLVLDDPASRANVMTTVLQDELDRRCDQLLAAKDQINGLIVSTAKDRIFIAGADIKLIATTGHYTKEQVLEFCSRGQKLYNRYAELPFPSIGLIHGACVGGGLEFAMGLDYRIASDDRSTIIGLPEVHLGLVPGWAATARVPRLCSVETALERIVTGVNIPAAEAAKCGLVDQVVPPESLQETALKHFQDKPAGWQLERRTLLKGKPTRLTLTDAPTSSIDKNEARKIADQILEDLAKNQPDLNMTAPNLVADLILDGIDVDLQQASNLEAEAMAKVYTSFTGQALVNTFLLGDRSRRSPGLPKKPADLREIKKVGILGLGLMGQSIAQLLSKSPWEIVLFDVKEEAQENAKTTFTDQKYSVAGSIDGLRECDVIIENVFERLELKQQVFADLEEAVSQDTVLLTNTSVIPVQQIGSKLKDASRFCGLHFFNPIKLTKLAEIARHSDSTDHTLWTAHQIAKALRKATIVVGDGPGLVVNRLLMALLNEAQALLADGWTIEEIDQAATDFGWRLGPFEILDVIGTQTAFDAGAQLTSLLPEAINAPPFLVPMVKSDRAGKSAGLGFYKYDENGKKVNDPTVYQALDAYRKKTTKEDDLSPEQAAGQMAFAMVRQASEILKSGQIGSARDLDLCTVLALGFPADKGGLLFWADHCQAGDFSQIVHPRDKDLNDEGFYQRYPEA